MPKDISCILTLHGEGFIAHKTIRSINRAVKYTKEHGLATELLIVLDRATSETIRYVETSSVIDPAARIISTDFGDTGLARNAGIGQACGEYVAILDGDDLISENWLVRAHEVNRVSDGYVVHPEVSFWFDQKTVLFYHIDQDQEDFDESNLIIENYWVSALFSCRETFLITPYSASPAFSGFGLEDWHWNCEVMARGLIHKVAPGTAYFYRIKEKGSRNAEAVGRNVLIRHSALFDNLKSQTVSEKVSARPLSPHHPSPNESFNQEPNNSAHTSILEKMLSPLILRLPIKFWRAIFANKLLPDWDEESYLACHSDVKAAVESGVLSSGFEHYVRLGRSEGRRLACAKIAEEHDIEMPPDWDDEHYLLCNPDVKAAVESGTMSSGFDHWNLHGRAEGRRLPVKIPKWIHNEMLALSEIEPMIFPSRAFFEKVIEHRPMKAGEVGPLYIQLLEEIGDQSFTHVFLLPWLKAGGADLVALHHIRTLESEFGAQILVILTEDTDSPWLQRLPGSVTTLHFGRASSHLDPLHSEVMLSRLLLKIQPAVIHNINSPIGWQIFCRYGAALGSESKLYVSLFCFDYTIEQEPIGYARELEKAHTYLNGIFTDNQRFAEKLMELYGLKDNLFSVLRYPVRVVPRFAYVEDDRQPKILWASRLDRQKRPDLLLKIAESLPDCIFHVYGDRLLDGSREITQIYEALQKMKNVTLLGSYSAFDAIPTDNYALFLYTSQFDGMPNVVLEALASGLAVLAPDVGGIREVIPLNSGFLIDRFDDVQAYVEAIRRVTTNPELIFVERDKRLKLLREKYCHEEFIASLANMPLYTLTNSKKAALIG